MTRWPSAHPFSHRCVAAVRLCAVALALGALTAPAVQAQAVVPYQVVTAREFPPTALYGLLRIDGPHAARLNGDPIAIAPGMRLIDQSNHLVPYTVHTGRSLLVRYMIEPSTGMLHKAWLLREEEIPPRRLLGLLPPAKQDPHEVQVAPLGVGVTKDGPRGGAPAARGIHGYGGIHGQTGIQGIAPYSGR